MNIQTITIVIAALLSATALPAHALNDATTVPYQDPTPKFAKPGAFAGAFLLRYGSSTGGFVGYVRPRWGGTDTGPGPDALGDWISEDGSTFTMRCRVPNQVTGRCSCVTPEPGRSIVQFSPAQTSDSGTFFRTIFCYHAN